eukprot:TRINITY_DN5657_c0_g1_i1.p1 TRINITY_DN5657_c0_g1~~TRINITY_DN5657_c0_g1_i1.p1  ORF type:complete len:723 (+),score=97.73 TRINITY_DN5657_c0_g1_i1:31-2169(+)
MARSNGKKGTGKKRKIKWGKRGRGSVKRKRLERSAIVNKLADKAQNLRQIQEAKRVAEDIVSSDEEENEDTEDEPQPYDNLCALLGVENKDHNAEGETDEDDEEEEEDEEDGEEAEEFDMEEEDQEDNTETISFKPIRASDLPELDDDDTAQDESMVGVTTEADALDEPSACLISISDPFVKKFFPTNQEHSVEEYSRVFEAQPRNTPLKCSCLAPVVTCTGQVPRFLKDSSKSKGFLIDGLNKATEDWNAFQSKIYAVLSHYYDFAYNCRTWDNQEELIAVVALHCLNHIRKVHTIIAQGHRKQEEDPPRDSSFTRCRVLILLPIANLAVHYVDALLQAAGLDKKHVSGLTEFNDEFRDKSRPRHLGEDGARQFAGNISDDFCVCLTLRKEFARLHTDRYNADVIIMSPLAAVFAISDATTFRSDFLSSIEILVMDQVDVMLMQNWDHVDRTLNSLNKPPRWRHSTADYARIHTWYLDKCAEFFRQSILLTRGTDPLIVAAFNRKCRNVSGKIVCDADHMEGELTKVINNTRSIFTRVDCSDVSQVGDARFRYFTQHIWPQLEAGMMSAFAEKGILLFVPSYYDYVRVRNFLEEADRESFSEVCEYTPKSEAKRNLAEFRKGVRPILLMTERCYFYFRSPIMKTRKVIFYAPPLYAHFYTAIVNQLSTGTAEDPTSYCYYTRFDVHSLQRLLGTDRTRRVFADKQGTHLFC